MAEIMEGKRKRGHCNVEPGNYKPAPEKEIASSLF